MKIFNFLCIVLFMAVFMTACQKESIENATTEVDLIAQIQADVALYEEVRIEHASLEELNQVFINNGQTLITLEEIGVTEEEYIAAQERIKNSDGVEYRCNYFYKNLMNMNDSYDADGFPTATSFDIVLARQVILNTTPPSIQSEKFGLITYFWLGFAQPLTMLDVAIAMKMILGIYTC